MPDTLTPAVRNLQARLAAGLPDLCLTGAVAADVFNGVWLTGVDVLITGDRITGLVPTGSVKAREIVDLTGKTILPAFIDSHVHIESSMLTPAHFSDLVVPEGTGTVVADPHEIANVLGTEGIRFMIENAEGCPLDIRFMLPSCVPATPFEHAGAVLEADDLAPFFNDPAVLGLAEVMNVPGVLAGDEKLLKKIALARSLGRPVDGHAPGVKGINLQRFAAAGITSDHECSTPEEVRARIACGMAVNLREGSSARTLRTLLKAVTPENAASCLFCNDDAHACDVKARGNMQKHLRIAVEEGLPAMEAVRMATINAARHYGLKEVGAVAPGWRADLAVVDNLTDFNVTDVFLKGRLAAQEGQIIWKAPVKTIPDTVLSRVNTRPLSEKTFALPLTGRQARVIRLVPNDLLTEEDIRPVVTSDGLFDAARNPGLVKLAVIERHHATGNRGLAILSGYIREDARMDGAVAVTVAHDSHNLIIAGGSDADMLTAAEALRCTGGGMVVVKKGRVEALLALPVAGLMTTETAEVFIEKQAAFYAKLRSLFDFAEGIDPVMTMAFTALPVIPAVRLTDMGLFDVTRFAFTTVEV